MLRPSKPYLGFVAASAGCLDDVLGHGDGEGDGDGGGEEGGEEGLGAMGMGEVSI